MPFTGSPYPAYPVIVLQMKPAPKNETKRKRPPTWVLNTLTALVGIATLAAGIGWLVYSWVVDREMPYFAIPLILCVPVIAAVAFRNIWD
jgi:hypothetical protein